VHLKIVSERDFEGHRIDLSAAIAKDIRVTNFWHCFGGG
jgi:hypothetical protein